MAFFCVCPPAELLPVLGQLERYVMPTLDAALLCTSRAVLIWVVYSQLIKALSIGCIELIVN